MKTNFLRVFAILAAAVTFVCCQEEDSLSISSSKIAASAIGDTQTINFETNTDWNIVSSADWVTVDPTSGAAGFGSVNVTIAANETFNTRKATLTLTAGAKTTAWEIEQDFVKVFGAASQINVDAKSQVISVAVTTNEAFTASTDCDWLSVASTKAVPSTKTVTVNVKANTGVEPRTGNVTIKSDSSEYSFAVTQAPSEDAAVLTNIISLGNSNFPYDADEYAPTSFQEVALKFETVKGSVVICVNTADGDFSGEYEVDASGKHVPGTFSVKPADKYAKYYTTIFEGSNEIKVADGLVSVEKSGENVSVSAQFIDEDENRYSYSYSGSAASVPVATDNIGASAYASYYGDYDTHFAKKQKEYSITLHPSLPLDGGRFVWSTTFDIFADASYDGKELPTGKFNVVFDDDVEYVDVPYSNGTASYPDNSSYYSSYDYVGFDFETGEYGYAEQTGGYVEISEGEVAGTFNFKVNLTYKPWSYDDDWNTVYGDEFSYVGEFKNVTVPIEDNHQEPIEDGDYTIVSGPSIAAYYTGYWYGDSYKTGGSVYRIGWNYIDGVFSVNLALHSAVPYVYEKNFNGRYCNTPVPAGTYTFSADSVQDSEGNPVNTICNVDSKTLITISNNYTGTNMVIVGGTVTIADDSVSFDLETSDGENTYSFKGGFPTYCYYFQDYSAETRQKQVKWSNLVIVTEPDAY